MRSEFSVDRTAQTDSSFSLPLLACTEKVISTGGNAERALAPTFTRGFDFGICTKGFGRNFIRIVGTDPGSRSRAELDVRRWERLGILVVKVLGIVCRTADFSVLMEEVLDGCG